jgi:HD domain
MSELVQAAKLFANSSHHRIEAHRNPVWQSPEVHLKSVAQLISSVSQNETMIAAAWLHDIVEDTGVTIGDLQRQFGAAVAKIVGELTPVSLPGHGDCTARFAVDRQHFASASAAAKTVKIADLIDTCRDLYKRDRASLGSYAVEARELAQVLEGGDAGLLDRLKRDLQRYNLETTAGVATTAAKLKPTALPITALRVFERAFSAQDIAEALLSFDFDRSANDVAAAMSQARVQVGGIRRNGLVCGFVEAEGLGEGSCELFRREFASGQVVVAGSSLTDVIEVLTRYDWCFVSAFGTVVGVISRIEMQKPATRMWLFGIVTVAELEFTERVRQRWSDESWIGLLSQQRLEKARQLRAERERQKENCELLDCLQLSDKMEILISDPEELARLGIRTPSAAKRASRQIESLRNSLAHAQGLVDHDWPQIVRLARHMEQTLRDR